MTDTDYEDLISQYGDIIAKHGLTAERLCSIAESAYQRGLRDGERIGLEKGAKVAGDYGDRMSKTLEQQRKKLQSGTVAECKLDAADTIETEIRALIGEQSDDDKV